jgi:hypothetical protein
MSADLRAAMLTVVAVSVLTFVGIMAYCAARAGLAAAQHAWLAASVLGLLTGVATGCVWGLALSAGLRKRRAGLDRRGPRTAGHGRA